MKKLFSFFGLFFVSALLFGQAHVSSSGISIQGIARDANNSALANIDRLTLDFTIYYLNSSNSEVQILGESGTVATDDFGVFNYVIDISNDKYVEIANTEAYLKVEQSGVVFSNEKLQTVPYAIHAQNGVPTGSILPFVGTESQVPPGWLLCDGRTFTRNAITEKLYQILGNSNTTPDLQAAVLKGTGVGARWSGYVGPDLRDTHGHQVMNHQHNINTNIDENTNEDGEHGHSLPFDSNGDGCDNDTLEGTGGNDECFADWYKNQMRPCSAHAHRLQFNLNVNTSNPNSGGGGENRVYSYGVNWIIKI